MMSFRGFVVARDSNLDTGAFAKKDGLSTHA